MASSAAGQFIATWRQSAGKQGEGVFGRFFNPSGQPTGGATRIDLGGATEVSLPTAAADAAGNFLVVWHQRAPSKTLQGGDGIFGRPFDPAGVPKASRCPSTPTRPGDPMNPVVASDASGNSVVVWMQDIGQGEGLDIWARRVAPGGLPIGTQFKVNATGAGNQVKPSVALNAAGDFVVAWESGPSGNKSIFGRFFTADGVPLGPDFEVARPEGGAVPETPQVTVDGTDLVTVSYTKTSSTGRTVVYRPFDVSTAPSACDPDAQTLCLNDSRFQVRVTWRNYNDNSTGVGRAVPITADTGYFWFFNSANVELVVKVLDGTWLNGNFWVFYGALSDVEYTITVTDTQTGGSVTYFNPARNLASVADTGALPGSAVAPPPSDYKVMTASGPADGAVVDRATVWGELVGDGGKLLACIPTATDLCLNNNRFQVRVGWRNYNDGSTGLRTGGDADRRHRLLLVLLQRQRRADPQGPRRTHPERPLLGLLRRPVRRRVHHHRHRHRDRPVRGPTSTRRETWRASPTPRPSRCLRIARHVGPTWHAILWMRTAHPGRGTPALRGSSQPSYVARLERDESSLRVAR